MAGLKRISWWQWITFPGRKWRIVTTVDAADEIPERLPAHGVVLVGSLEHPKWIAFDCPCKSGHRIIVALDRAYSPHWRITSIKKLSITPSIDYCGTGRRCHYFITKGRTVWARDM